MQTGTEWLLVVVYLSFRPGSEPEFKVFPPYATQEACIADKKTIDANIKTPGSQWFARCFKRKLEITHS